MKYYVVMTRGPKGRHTGYAVRDLDTDADVKLFRIRDFGYWRFAQRWADAHAAELNAAARVIERAERDFEAGNR
jgi:hypothetical protein